MTYAPIAVALTLLSLISGFSQIKTEGLAWQEANYWPQLEAVARGTAPAPYQYRLLTDILAVSTVRSAEALGVPRPIGTALLGLRLLLNLALFAVTFLFYRRLAIAPYPALLGLSALAWGITQSNYGSDLALSATTDILFFLAAALVVLEGRPNWLVGIAALAALNRESSIFLPYMAVACTVDWQGAQTLKKLDTRPALLALVVWCVVFAVIHGAIGPRPWGLSKSGAAPGLSMMWHNLTLDTAWGHTVGALGVIPVLALLSWRGWHPMLKPIFWSVVPLWCLVHLFCAPLDQSRVLLLPQILVFIPATLCGLSYWRNVQAERRKGLLV